MRGAHPERDLERRVAQRIAPLPGETLVVALSGGGDSVALAALAARAATAAGATVLCAHVNHALRESAWQDEAVALAAGAALGVRVTSVALPGTFADEARLRESRYAALGSIARQAGAARVLTAHHAEDQTESVLLALFRGAGADGLLGIARTRDLCDGVRLERPLLEVPKSLLVAYAAARHLPVALDPSNALAGYRRNALRAALGGLRGDFPGLDEAVARAATILRQERERAPRADLRRQLRSAIAAGAGDARDLTFERLDAAAAAIEAERTGRLFLRPGVELLIAPAPRVGGENERTSTKAHEHRTA